LIKASLVGHSTLSLIDTINGKNISPYSHQPDQNEVILCPDTRLRLLTERLDQKPIGELQLQEITVNRALSWKKKAALMLFLHVLVVLIGLLVANAETPASSIFRSLSFGTSDATANIYEGEWKNGLCQWQHVRG
jgi:hypothetical protein